MATKLCLWSLNLPNIFSFSKQHAEQGQSDRTVTLVNQLVSQRHGAETDLVLKVQTLCPSVSENILISPLIQSYRQQQKRQTVEMQTAPDNTDTLSVLHLSK